MKRIVLLVLLLALNSSLVAAIYTVSLDGTSDFSAIQDGIDASSNGDTILVYPGTYYENINYNGKNITVASLYLTTQIDSFVKTTIIDGNHNGSVVKVINGEDETAMLCGFTIQNGTGSIDQYNYICGGGLNVYDSQIVINNCIIRKNRADYGGGIYIGGSYSGDACPTLENCLITSNHTYRYGGGLVLSYWASVTFSQDELCNIYFNSGAVGSDIYRGGSDSDPIHVYVDTFTVMEPDAFFFSDFVGSTIDIQHGKITPMNQDLYVSPYGDNANIGLTEDEPLKNIYFALTKIASDRLHPNTIHISEGTYSPSLNGEKYPLNLRSYITLDGVGKEQSILDAEELSCIFYDYDYQRDYTIRDMKVVNGKQIYSGALRFYQPRGAVIENVRFENNTDPAIAGRSVIASTSLSAFILDSTSIVLKNVEVVNNHGGVAVGLGPFECTKIENTIIKSNTPNYAIDDWSGYGLLISGHPSYENRWFSEVINTEITENVNATTEWPNAASALVVTNKQNADFINCTIGNNDAPLSGEGISIEDGSNVGFYNCILYGDDPREMYVDGRTYPNTITFSHTLLEGGQWDIAVQGTNTFNWLDGNLDTNPMWEGIGEYPYYLSTGSPCIDAGTLNLPDSIEIPLYDLAGNPRIYGDMIDMGAYEWQGYGIDEPELPENIIAFMNSPNPFTDHTNIICSLKDIQSNKDISLKIFNSRGQLIKTFVKSNFESSPFTELYWDGTDERGNEVAPGAYFYKLRYGNKEVMRKMVKLTY